MRNLAFAMGCLLLVLAGCAIPATGDPASDERLAPADLDLTLPPSTAAHPPFSFPADDGTRWTLWGGPNRDFTSTVTGLAETWPPQGPPVLWRRPLGEGYSGIAVEDGVLYTMYRTPSGEEEVVTALDAGTGETRWEHRYEAPFESGYAPPGPGPYAMPQVVGDRLISVGATGKLYALDKRSGDVVWFHDLYEEFGGTQMTFGYANHPLPYRDTLILMVGGQDHSLVALRTADGSVVWRRHSYRNSYSTPVLINVDGQDKVVTFLSSFIVGVDPNTGDLLWRHPHDTEYDLAIIMPVWGDDNLLLYSATDGGGCGVLHLKRVGEYTVAEPQWHTNRVRFHFTSVLRIGNIAYGSSGKDGATPFTAVDVRSGEIRWQSRAIAKASFVLADGRLIFVDEEGHLGLAKITPEGLQVVSKVRMLGTPAWTVPSLVGTTMYVRDRREIMAMNVSDGILEQDRL